MRVIEQSQISPAPGSVPETSLPSSFFDLFWVEFSMAVERCFFYPFPHPTSHFIDHHLPSLKSSLSLTLQHFFPLAGKLRPSSSSDDLLELHYAPGDSVSLTVAEIDEDDNEDFLDLVASHPRPSSRLRRLVPQLVDKSLLAIQLSVFPNRGLCFGFAIHHVACDGFSYAHFVKTWAAAAADLSTIPAPPSFDRTAIVSLHNYNSIIKKIIQVLKQGSAGPPPPPATDLLAATFRLGAADIGELKRAAKSRCSTFVATAGFLWACFVKLRGYPDSETVHLPMAVDWRQRLQPAPPATYFGNCVFFAVAEGKAGEVAKGGGAAAIARAIDGLRDGIGGVLEGTEGEMKTARPNPVFSIAGSPRLGVYEADFGWGRPVKVEVVSIDSRSISLAESREEAGGVQIGVALNQNEMEKFAAIFAQGLQHLST